MEELSAGGCRGAEYRNMEKSPGRAVGMEAVDEAREERCGGPAVGWGGVEGAGTEDSGCRAKGNGPGRSCHHSPKAQCVPFGCVEGREASAPEAAREGDRQGRG